MSYDFDYSGELILLDERVERFVDYAFEVLPWLEGTERTVGDVLREAFHTDDVVAQQPVEAPQGQGAATAYSVYGVTRGDRPVELLSVFAHFGWGEVDFRTEGSLWRCLLTGGALHTANAVVTYPDLDGVTTEVVPDLDDVPVLA